MADTELAAACVTKMRADLAFRDPDGNVIETIEVPRDMAQALMDFSVEWGGIGKLKK